MTDEPLKLYTVKIKQRVRGKTREQAEEDAEALLRRLNKDPRADVGDAEVYVVEGVIDLEAETVVEVYEADGENERLVNRRYQRADGQWVTDFSDDT